LRSPSSFVLFLTLAFLRPGPRFFIESHPTLQPFFSRSFPKGYLFSDFRFSPPSLLYYSWPASFLPWLSGLFFGNRLHLGSSFLFQSTVRPSFFFSWQVRSPPQFLVPASKTHPQAFGLRRSILAGQASPPAEVGAICARTFFLSLCLLYNSYPFFISVPFGFLALSTTDFSLF